MFQKTRKTECFIFWKIINFEKTNVENISKLILNISKMSKQKFVLWISIHFSYEMRKQTSVSIEGTICPSLASSLAH